jgi:tetratricopeptide (TPR) repeat protein
MKCPFCATENREDRESCYHCGKDISMLRVIVNKARHHYNVALEHAERQRHPEALAELEHCLELDHSFVPAHVVMGTVYAKMEKFDAAERCWQAALALDPHILKAHEYIGKGGLAKQAVPLLKRLRWAIGLALALAGILALMILWQLRPASDKADIKRISAEIEKGNYGEALDLAQHVENTARSYNVRHAARLFAETIRQRYESAAIDMLALLLDNKPVEAHELFLHLVQGRALPVPLQRQLLWLDNRAADQAVVLMDSWRRQMDEGTLSYDDLVKKADRIGQVFAQRADMTQKKVKMLALARQAMVANTLNRLPASPISTTETLTWLGRLRDLSNRVPESRDVLTSASKRLVVGGIAQMEQRMDGLLAGKDPAPVRSSLDVLQRMAAYGRTEAADRLIEKTRAGLRRLERDRFKVQLSAAVIADIPQLDTWVAVYEKATSSTIAKDADASSTLARTRRRLAGEMVSWCSDREMRFMRKKITNDEARLVADRAEFALQYYAGKTWRDTRDCVTFCAAIAWLQLGKTQEALRWFDRLQKTYPESSYLSVAHSYRKKIEEDLKIPIPPAE